MTQSKIKICVEVKDVDGRPVVHWTTEEDNPTMKDVALAVYQLEQINLDLLDREWSSEGYEIIGKGDEDG